MKLKTTITTITLAALPFFAVAAAQHDHQSPQASTQQNPGSGMTAGHEMMNVIDQVSNDLAALANENDPAVLHQRIAQNRVLLEKFQAHMSGRMQGMKGMKEMKGGCGGMVHQPQK